MEVQVIAALIGIAGVTLSAVFSGFGYYAKVRAEKLRTTRQVLFYLLEFRAHVLASAMSPSELYDQYLNECRKYFDKKRIAGVVIPQQNQELMLGYFSQLIEQITPELSQEFISGYSNTINELAKDKPILAFQLRGKDVATKMVMLQKSYLEQLQSTDLFATDQSISAFLQKQVTEAHDNGLREVLALLDEELTVVSRACGVVHYIKVRKIVKSKVKPTTNLEDVGIEEMFDSLLLAFSHHINSEQECVENDG
ncbi:hypothetical protein BCT11_22965 [Vibrio sp. 10N.222.52.B12]|uniref:hypothetical protein n=1 Tax=Vibrio sp. 10N.222.52.B12 TaxID=1880840 RepID=UPI000C83B9C2|nr:hypothetical protein [Vibrio sp. 10N.222.52.B12]PMO35294.1 hypothetical protein BCT11_22965 [Vibrio sp. 10N.222.52.B12]